MPQKSYKSLDGNFYPQFNILFRENREKINQQFYLILTRFCKFFNIILLNGEPAIHMYTGYTSLNWIQDLGYAYPDKGPPNIHTQSPPPWKFREVISWVFPTVNRLLYELNYFICPPFFFNIPPTVKYTCIGKVLTG